MSNRKWTRDRLDRLQAQLDRGMVPSQCATFFSEEYGPGFHTASICGAISAHGLRHAAGGRGAIGEPAEPPCPPQGRVDYAPFDEDPGDARDRPYRQVAKSWVMPRKGEF